MKGVPVRLVMGGRDLENNTMEVMRRDTLEKETVTCEGIETYVQNLLEEMQANIYKKALDYRNSKITTVDTYDEFCLIRTCKYHAASRWFTCYHTFTRFFVSRNK